MKYRHAFHAGNFADLHKHVTLLALLAALERKDKGFLYLDTHAGRGSYDLSHSRAEAVAGIGRFLEAAPRAAELQHYARALASLRAGAGQRHLYPGSPLLAAAELRPQDRAVFGELLASEAQALRTALAAQVGLRGRAARLRVVRGEGLALLRECLPPPERRALAFIDPPYEEPPREWAEVVAALADALERFPTGVFAAWYPVKEQRTATAWQAELSRTVAAPTLSSELWLYPRDSRVSLNGSGLLIVNPPWRIEERMRLWLPELLGCLVPGAGAGTEVRMLSQSGHR
jgi:23S rRNA (adenine2030-N6)-methyltransferase